MLIQLTFNVQSSVVAGKKLSKILKKYGISIFERDERTGEWNRLK